MGGAITSHSFAMHAVSEGLNLIEGNRGLFDGADAAGTHSTAELAKLLGAPVLLVIDAAKVTHTIAASVLGCQKLDPTVQIKGVILNRVAGQRHEAMLRESVESVCGIPVLGVLPKIERCTLLPSRHLGLVTPQEHGQLDELAHTLLSLIEARLDLNRIMAVAGSASHLDRPTDKLAALDGGQGLRIGYLKDSAFTFYYPENLEALEMAGAHLVSLSALFSPALPEDLDALYIGGGFPETHAAALAANAPLLASIREHAANGLPIYAECGGLMLLSQAIDWKGVRFPMAGVLPVEAEVCPTPQGHGYVELLADRPNPYFPVDTKIRGHEFHYSRLFTVGDEPATACAVQRGTGSLCGRDGLLKGNVWASYTHVHAAATPEWAKGLLGAARRFSTCRSSSLISCEHKSSLAKLASH
jgi:cobyrinic acid a,c-diamide synthase